MLIGIVGKPSCGKSTFFKAATLAEAEIASYPFTTIKPNEAIGYIKVECVDKEFGVQCNPREGYCIDGNRFVPVKLLDVAGLIPGAHKGLGMGNQFLNDLSQAAALIHVVDISGSTNEKGEEVPALSYDSANDVRFLEEEIDLWYLGLIKKGWERFARRIVQEKTALHKTLGRHLEGLGVTEKMVEDVIKKIGLDANRPDKWTDDELKNVAVELRKTTKPMIIACNKVDIPGAEDNFERVKKEFPDYIMVPCSSESELALREAAKHGLIRYIPGENDFKIIDEAKLNEKQRKALDFIKENILKRFGSTGVQEVLDKAAFDLLKLIAIFPGGVGKLQDQNGNYIPDCFLLPDGSTALDFAYKIHTDLGDKFIRAIDVKKKMTVGKEHKLKHRDVVEIVTSR
jgi:ribosome-binding ATPase YchF (GTP1/OBG family)